MTPGTQGDLFSGPAPSRETDTSRDAADSIAPRLGKLRAAVLAAIRAAGARGLTADEAAEKLDIKILTARPRCSELHKEGLIADSGRRRPSTGSDHSMTVWVARRIP